MLTDQLTKESAKSSHQRNRTRTAPSRKLLDGDIPARERAALGITITQRDAEGIRAAVGAAIHRRHRESNLRAPVIERGRAGDRGSVSADRELAQSHPGEGHAAVGIAIGERASRNPMRSGHIHTKGGCPGGATKRSVAIYVH